MKPSGKLKYGFEFVRPDATISIDIMLKALHTKKLLEFLYFE